MNIALDTNAYRDFMRGDAAKVQTIRLARTIQLPLIVLGELRAGFAAGNRQSQNAANLLRFLNSPRVSILSPDEHTTHHYAQIFASLRKRGIAIPTNALWIAALCIQHRLILCSADTHFDSIHELPRC